MDSQRLFVFIGGVHRSGTTLVGQLLAEHPQASGFANTGVPADEGQHLQSLYPPARAFGGPGRFAFDEGAALTESSDLLENARQRLIGAWAPHWDMTRPVLIEKSPPNLLRFRFLQAAFPEAHMVAVFRHPIAVAYATQKWSKTSIPALLEHWLVAYERFAHDKPLIDHLHHIRYESLVANPQAALADLETSLGLSPQTVRRNVETGSNERYFERWRSESQRALSGLGLRRAAHRLEDRAGAFNYSLLEL